MEKTFEFGLRIIKLHLYLKDKHVDRILTIQLLRSGTSIGANVEESMGASSRKDFIQKLSISYREARETKYWIRLITESNLLDQKISDSLLVDLNEIIKILASIITSSKYRTNS